MLNLVTNRTAFDVSRLKQLNEKGAENWTEDELNEWFGISTELLYCLDGVVTCLDGEIEIFGSGDPVVKGAYNSTDLNRVGAAVEYVRNRLAQYDYKCSVNPKQSWTYTDIPTQQELDEYLEDIRTIRSALATKPTTPQAPADMEQFNYIEANNIEQILLDVDALITNMTMSFVFCGQPFSGQIWEEFTQ